MGKENRRGERKGRILGRNNRAPQLGYYLIVTDTKETERNYFHGLRDTIPDHLKDKLVIKVDRANTIELVDRCLEMVSLEPQYRMPWIVFDKDQVKEFDKIIQKAEANQIKVGWSNPCIEIWFYAYFGQMPYYLDSVQCCAGFEDYFERKTRQKYKKSDKQIYPKLCEYGDQEQAIKLARQKLSDLERDCNDKPSKMCPCTTLHLLIEEITRKFKK